MAGGHDPVTDERALVQFLYLLMREVPTGKIEAIIREVREPYLAEFTNPHLARFAQEIADRLDGGFVDEPR